MSDPIKCACGKPAIEKCHVCGARLCADCARGFLIMHCQEHWEAAKSKPALPAKETIK